MNKIYLTLLLLCVSFLSVAQTRDIKGKIQDEDGKPMIGVTVLVKGTGNGAITDAKGLFSISAEGPVTLGVSFIGYIPQDIQVKDAQTSVSDIKLMPDFANLHEVIVVGYGTQAKVNLTGAVDNIDMKDLENRPISQASMTLQGQVAGVDVVQSSGRPGADEGSIRIRGISSIENNNEPLVLIDGVEGNINQINPKDIESMSVLKDAASASIYGARAAAGVVLITTRQGTVGQMKVSYNGTFSLQQPTALPKAVKVQEYLDLKEEMFLYNGEIKNFDSDREKYASGEKVSVNFYLRHFRIAPSKTHHINISGGSENFKGSFQLGFADQDGVLKGTGNKNYSFRSNVDAKSAGGKVFAKFNVSGYRRETTETAMGSNQTIQDIHRAGPTSVFQAHNGLYGFYGRHMAQLEAGGRSLFTTNNVIGKATMGFEPIKGLVFSGSFSANYMGAKRDEFAAPIFTVGDLYGDIVNKVVNYVEIRNSNTLSTTTEALATYKKKIKKHDFNALLGYSQMWWRSDWEEGRRENMMGFQPSLNMGDPATQTNGNAISERALLSYFGRIGYNYDNKYLFEFNVRRDGSSRFVNTKWGAFPSASVGWRLSEENFFKKSSLTKTVTNIKVRASVGKLGNEYIYSNYTGYPVLSTENPYDFGGAIVGGAAITELSNRSTTWETSTMYNVGLDVTLFSKLTLTADAFIKETEDILIKRPIAPSLIGSVNGGPYQNVGSMENKGVELTVNYRQKFRNGINFDATFITAAVRNKIVDLGGDNEIIMANNSPIIHRVGQPMGSFYGYRMDGIYQLTDFTWQNDSDASIPLNERTYKLKEDMPVPSEGSPRPGDIKLSDISGPDGVKDGKIDLDYDRVVIGSPFPDVTMSLNTNLAWKGVDFNMFWQASIGRDMYNQGPMVVPFFNDNGNVWKDMVDKRWTVDNPTNDHPRINYDTKTANTRSSYYVYNASFLRLKNVELGYSLPQRWISHLKLSKVRVYAGIQNALTITNFPGWDPERPATNIASEVYPQVVVYSFGLNINF